jgi:hypothetical protein
MTDDRELAGLDPFALLDNESGRLDAFLSGLGESGGTDLDSVNALGVASYAALSPAQVLARWRAASAGNRSRAGSAVLPAVPNGGNRAARPGEKTGRRAKAVLPSNAQRHDSAHDRAGPVIALSWDITWRRK